MFPPVKKCISCCLSHQNPHTYLFRAVLSCKRCLICADFSPDSDQTTFSLEEALLWIMDSYFSLKTYEKVLKGLNYWICFLQTCSFCLLQMLTDGLEWCGLLVDYCDVFISCYHSDGTHSLQRIHLWTSDGMLHFSKSDEETNSSTSWMAWGCGHFHLCLNYSFNSGTHHQIHFLLVDSISPSHPQFFH